MQSKNKNSDEKFTGASIMNNSWSQLLKEFNTSKKIFLETLLGYSEIFLQFWLQSLDIFTYFQTLSPIYRRANADAVTVVGLCVFGSMFLNSFTCCCQCQTLYCAYIKYSTLFTKHCMHCILFYFKVKVNNQFSIGLQSMTPLIQQIISHRVSWANVVTKVANYFLRPTYKLRIKLLEIS